MRKRENLKTILKKSEDLDFSPIYHIIVEDSVGKIKWINSFKKFKKAINFFYDLEEHINTYEIKEVEEIEEG